MSPILLRPIREQLEHDRVLRQLQTRWKRRFEVSINFRQEETASVRSRKINCYPDLILIQTIGSRRVHGVVEVETAESVNRLEAMAQWSHFARVRGAFYLYVPAGFADIAERLCRDNDINVSEIWSYYAIGSQVKFSRSYRSAQAERAAKANREKTISKGSSKKARAKTVKTVAKKSKKSKTKPGTNASKKVKKSKTSKNTRKIRTTATKPSKKIAKRTEGNSRTSKTSKTSKKRSKARTAKRLAVKKTRKKR